MKIACVDRPAKMFYCSTRKNNYNLMSAASYTRQRCCCYFCNIQLASNCCVCNKLFLNDLYQLIQVDGCVLRVFACYIAPYYFKWVDRRFFFFFFYAQKCAVKTWKRSAPYRHVIIKSRRRRIYTYVYLIHVNIIGIERECKEQVPWGFSILIAHFFFSFKMRVVFSLSLL